MRKVHLTALGCVLITFGVVLAGCGTPTASSKVKVSSTTTTTASSVAKSLPGYLATSTSEAIFIEYTDSGGSISGTVQAAYLSSNGSQVETANGSITGTISGANVTIMDTNGVLTNSGNLSGTLQGSDLALSVPQSNGQLAAIQFQPSSVADYNSAVAVLQASASQTSAAQQKAQEQQQAAQQAAAAAAQAKANAELQAAQGPCDGVGGSVYGSPPNLSCNEIGYIGNDGSTYYASVSINAATGQLMGPMGTDGIGATKQECTSDYYPELSTGPGYGQKGTWNASLAVCLPKS